MFGVDSLQHPIARHPRNIYRQKRIALLKGIGDEAALARLHRRVETDRLFSFCAGGEFAFLCQDKWTRKDPTQEQKRENLAEVKVKPQSVIPACSERESRRFQDDAHD